CRLEVGLFRFLDDRVHDVCLSAHLHLSVDELEDALAPRLTPQRSRDRTAARRTLVENAEIQVAIQRERERTRNRRGGHEQHVGRVAFGAEGFSLLHTESMLFVDRREPELGEYRCLLHERVRTDDEHWLA